MSREFFLNALKSRAFNERFIPCRPLFTEITLLIAHNQGNASYADRATLRFETLGDLVGF